MTAANDVALTGASIGPISLCANCVFFEGRPDPVTGKTSGGICRRNPPTPIVLYGQNALSQPTVNLQSHFPPVGAGEWCGEHESEADQ